MELRGKVEIKNFSKSVNDVLIEKTGVVLLTLPIPHYSCEK